MPASLLFGFAALIIYSIGFGVAFLTLHPCPQKTDRLITATEIPAPKTVKTIRITKPRFCYEITDLLDPDACIPGDRMSK